MEEGVNNEEDDKKEITADNEDEGVIHRDIKEYEKYTIWYTWNKLIEECPYKNYSVDMEGGINNEDYEKEIKSQNEDGGVIHRNITENKG